ncbi:hypothetical protein BaRGS_00037183 [Batillaria attramentaria]|uniref:Uncharacterized protein n=1 Tax=Batillaria attramentaria TaxID=370345 RepID=A0ABD0J9B2_9CAEN
MSAIVRLRATWGLLATSADVKHIFTDISLSEMWATRGNFFFTAFVGLFVFPIDWPRCPKLKVFGVLIILTVLRPLSLTTSPPTGPICPGPRVSLTSVPRAVLHHGTSHFDGNVRYRHLTVTDRAHTTCRLGRTRVSLYSACADDAINGRSCAARDVRVSVHFHPSCMSVAGTLREPGFFCFRHAHQVSLPQPASGIKWTTPGTTQFSPPAMLTGQLN